MGTALRGQDLLVWGTGTVLVVQQLTPASVWQLSPNPHPRAAPALQAGPPLLQTQPRLGLCQLLPNTAEGTEMGCCVCFGVCVCLGALCCGSQR